MLGLTFVSPRLCFRFIELFHDYLSLKIFPCASIYELVFLSFEVLFVLAIHVTLVILTKPFYNFHYDLFPVSFCMRNLSVSSLIGLHFFLQIQPFEPFNILGLEPGASDSEIKKAYRKLSILYHPDKNPDPGWRCFICCFFIFQQRSPMPFNLT